MKNEDKEASGNSLDEEGMQALSGRSLVHLEAGRIPVCPGPRG